MKYTRIVPELPAVSRIWLGCWSFGGGEIWGEQSRKDTIATVDYAIDAGINIFDTAEQYNEGRSETVLGDALVGKRSNVLIASKVRQESLSKDALIRACEQSLVRLKTDYIDIYQIHWMDYTQDLDDIFESLEYLRDQGKIRSFGVCNFGTETIRNIPEAYSPVSNQLCYNLLFRSIETGIVKSCRNKNIPIVAYSPLAQGLLTGKYPSLRDVPDNLARTRMYTKNRPNTRHNESGFEEELDGTIRRIRQICAVFNVSMLDASLSWIFSKPFINAAVIGARKPDQLRQSAAAVDFLMSEKLQEALDEATKKLIKLYDGNADLWSAESRIK